MEYLHGNEDKYSKGLFENVFVQLDPTSSTLYDAWETRRRAPKPAQRAAIERSLRENNGLQIGYAVLVYAGPMLEEEIRDIVAAREERRTREAPWKVAVEQYEADLKIWKKAAKRAKAKGEAEPPKPERPEKPKKPQKARKQAKRAGGKGVKPAKRTQRVQEEMEDEEDEQEAHDEDDSEGGEQEEEQDDEE
ncbi:RHTO0S18e02036g1_1 [Rhodotorula toruloides]|uniref:RHTO0S18e02036g1_1 n=2 Tax=Rhodotorula toruloides TaxID=5286 RepID=A0A061BEX4_RHOTO|nr:RHTO0S18e02036g1_1 [Rhodotorula toruloides]